MIVEDLNKLTKQDLIGRIQDLHHYTESQLTQINSLRNAGNDIVKANTEMGEKIKELANQRDFFRTLVATMNATIRTQSDALFELAKKG